MRQLLVVLALVLAVTGPATVARGGWLDFLRNATGTKTTTTGATSLTAGEAAAGLQEALTVAIDRVTEVLGRPDAFNADPKLHIPLPASLARVQQALAPLGMAGMLDDLETRINRAAEAAVPKVRPLLRQAVSEMRFQDAMAILNGPEDAATRYFQEKMGPQLREEMRPVVDATLDEAGAVQLLDQVMGRYRTLPFVPDVQADLDDHVLDYADRALFDYLAKEEAAIRRDPVKRTTALLQKVFAAPR